MFHLLDYWYLRSAGRFWQAYLSTFHQLEGSLAVRETLRNINKPLFQDYTLAGRFIGVLLRLARAGAGLFVELIFIIFYLIAYFLWLAFPFICLISLVGAVSQGFK